MHTRFLPQSFASRQFTTHIYPSHYTPLYNFPTLHFTAIPFTSLHFTSLHYTFFTLLKYAIPYPHLKGALPTLLQYALLAWAGTTYFYLDCYMRVGTLLVIVATIYLQLIQNRYMFRSFTLLQCSHQHCVQPVASDVEVVGYI